MHVCMHAGRGKVVFIIVNIDRRKDMYVCLTSLLKHKMPSSVGPLVLVFHDSDFK